jgi:hypothetical protein
LTCATAAVRSSKRGTILFASVQQAPPVARTLACSTPSHAPVGAPEPPVAGDETRTRDRQLFERTDDSIIHSDAEGIIVEVKPGARAAGRLRARRADRPDRARGSRSPRVGRPLRRKPSTRLQTVTPGGWPKGRCGRPISPARCGGSWTDREGGRVDLPGKGRANRCGSGDGVSTGSWRRDVDPKTQPALDGIEYAEAAGVRSPEWSGAGTPVSHDL